MDEAAGFWDRKVIRELLFDLFDREPAPAGVGREDLAFSFRELFRWVGGELHCAEVGGGALGCCPEVGCGVGRRGPGSGLCEVVVRDLEEGRSVPAKEGVEIGVRHAGGEVLADVGGDAVDEDRWSHGTRGVGLLQCRRGREDGRGESVPTIVSTDRAPPRIESRHAQVQTSTHLYFALWCDMPRMGRRMPPAETAH